MKKLIFSAILLSLFAVAQAQEPGKDRHDKMKHHKGMMMEKLNFSTEQKTQLKALNEDFRKQMEALKKSEGTMTVTEWKSKRQALASSHKAKIQNLLTADQKAQMEKMRSAGKGMHEKHDRMRLEKMKTELGLSEVQVNQLKQHRTAMEQKMKLIREDKSLDDAAKREQIKELMKANKENMKSIFTKEQLEKMKEGRKDHEKGNKVKREKETI